MQWNIVPVGAEVDGNFNRSQRRSRAPLIPKRVVGRVLDRDGAPELTKWMLGIVSVDYMFENADDRLAIEVLEPGMIAGMLSMSRTRSIRAPRQKSSGF